MMRIPCLALLLYFVAEIQYEFPIFACEILVGRLCYNVREG